MADCDLTIAGTLGRDPELRFTPGGQGLATFSVAVSRRWQDKDKEWQEKTTWINVTAWGQLGENCASSLHKGSRVVCKGRLEEDEWEDKQTGEKRRAMKMIADEVAASLKWATVDIHRIEREQGDSGRTRTKGPRPRDEEPF